MTLQCSFEPRTTTLMVGNLFAQVGHPYHIIHGFEIVSKHLASWVGVCPGNKQSGGKRLSSKTTHGNPWLRSILAEVAWAISHTTDNYLAAQFHRLARRLGQQKAVMASSHSVLVILYHMLRDHRPYHDLGPDYFAQLDRQRLEHRHVRRLEQLGYTVTLTPAPAA